MTHLCLIVESDPHIAIQRRRDFPRFGIRPYMVESFESARDVLRNWHFDGVVVNAAAFGPSCCELLPRLRPLSPVPVLLLMDAGDEEHLIALLEAGATDVIRGPASTQLIAAKLRRLQQVRPVSGGEVDTVRIGPLLIDKRAFRVFADGSPLDLTPYQYDLLALLASRPGEAVSRDEIVQLLMGGSDTRVVDVHVSRIRKKLTDLNVHDVTLRTVRGRGYSLTLASPRFEKTVDELTVLGSSSKFESPPEMQRRRG